MRDQNETCYKVGGISTNGKSAFYNEALAIKMGITAAIEEKIEYLCIETDSMELVDTISKNKERPWHSVLIFKYYL